MRYPTTLPHSTATEILPSAASPPRVPYHSLVQTELDDLRQKGLTKKINRHFTLEAERLKKERKEAEDALQEIIKRKAELAANPKLYEKKVSRGSDDMTLTQLDALHMELQRKKQEVIRKEKELSQKLYDKCDEQDHVATLPTTTFPLADISSGALSEHDDGSSHQWQETEMIESEGFFQSSRSEMPNMKEDMNGHYIVDQPAAQPTNRSKLEADHMELMVQQHNKLINRMDDLYESLEKERESSIQLNTKLSQERIEKESLKDQYEKEVAQLINDHEQEMQYLRSEKKKLMLQEEASQEFLAKYSSLLSEKDAETATLEETMKANFNEQVEKLKRKHEAEVTELTRKVNEKVSSLQEMKDTKALYEMNIIELKQQLYAKQCELEGMQDMKQACDVQFSALEIDEMKGKYEVEVLELQKQVNEKNSALLDMKAKTEKYEADIMQRVNSALQQTKEMKATHEMEIQELDRKLDEKDSMLMDMKDIKALNKQKLLELRQQLDEKDCLLRHSTCTFEGEILELQQQLSAKDIQVQKLDEERIKFVESCKNYDEKIGKMSKEHINEMMNLQQKIEKEKDKSLDELNSKLLEEIQDKIAVREQYENEIEQLKENNDLVMEMLRKQKLKVLGDNHMATEGLVKEHEAQMKQIQQKFIEEKEDIIKKSFAESDDTTNKFSDANHLEREIDHLKSTLCDEKSCKLHLERENAKKMAEVDKLRNQNQSLSLAIKKMRESLTGTIKAFDGKTAAPSVKRSTTHRHEPPEVIQLDENLSTYNLESNHSDKLNSIRLNDELRALMDWNCVTSQSIKMSSDLTSSLRISPNASFSSADKSQNEINKFHNNSEDESYYDSEEGSCYDSQEECSYYDSEEELLYELQTMDPDYEDAQLYFQSGPNTPTDTYSLYQQSFDEGEYYENLNFEQCSVSYQSPQSVIDFNPIYSRGQTTGPYCAPQEKDSSLGAFDCPEIKLVILSVPITEKIKKMARFFSIQIVDDPLEATHVIAGSSQHSMRRSVKLMIALCVTSNILKGEWLEESFKRKELLSCNRFLLLNDSKAEKSYSFSMRNTLREGRERRENGGLFRGWKILVCEGVCGNKAPKEHELKTMVEAAGGIWLTRNDIPLPIEDDPTHVIVITSDPAYQYQIEDPQAEIAAENGAGFYTTSWLFNVMMHQKIFAIRRGLGRW